MCSPWVYPAWNSLCFLDVVDYFLFHMREVFSYYLFKYFHISSLSLSFPSRTFIMQMLVCLMLSQRSPRLFSFFLPSFFCILFCGSDFYHSVFQVTYPFCCLSYSATDSFWCIIHLYLSLVLLGLW